MSKTEKEITGQVKLHRIYTKGSVFESSAMTLPLLQNLPSPVVDQQIYVNLYSQADGVQEAVLVVQLTAKHQGNLLWRLQLQQAGLYHFDGFTEEQIKQILNGFCMNQLYPYACAEVNRLVTQAGFLPVYLTPVNFDQLYREQEQSKVPDPATSVQ